VKSLGRKGGLTTSFAQDQEGAATECPNMFEKDAAASLVGQHAVLMPSVLCSDLSSVKAVWTSRVTKSVYEKKQLLHRAEYLISRRLGMRDTDNESDPHQ
jgi:hypothetical protein